MDSDLEEPNGGPWIIALFLSSGDKNLSRLPGSSANFSSKFLSPGNDLEYGCPPLCNLPFEEK